MLGFMGLELLAFRLKPEFNNGIQMEIRILKFEYHMSFYVNLVYYVKFK